MEINDNDIRLARNTLAIDDICRQKQHVKEYDIGSLEARINNVEERIAHQQQYLKMLNDDLTKYKNMLQDMEDKHSKLIDERRQLLGQTK